MIKLDKVSKKFGTGVFALSDISFTVDKGEFVFLVGSTGSGKTTVFRLLIRDLLPSDGNIIINEYDLANLQKDELSHLRKKIGVVFQDLKLLSDRTVFENVALPLDVIGKSPEVAQGIVDEILSQVGLSDHKDKFPVQLSGGELQRVAIARALILSPEILLADEPTGNLDDDTSWEIVDILVDINKKGTTVVMATHNMDIIKKLGKRVIYLEKGKLKDEKDKKEKKEDKEQEEKKHEEAEEKTEEEEEKKKEKKK